MLAKSKERRDWLVVAAMAGAILLLVPFARLVDRVLLDRLDARIILSVATLLVIGSMAFLVRAIRRALKVGRIRIFPDLLLGTACLAFLVWLIWSRRDLPVEALHVLLYGGFAVGMLLALRHRLHGVPLYLVAGLLSVTMGVTDELFQWWTPKRYGEIGDVMLNACASIAALAVVGFLVRPEGAKARKTSKRLIGLTILIAATSLLIFLHITPERVLRWIAPEGTLAWRSDKNNLGNGCADFGYRYEFDTQGLAMKSRDPNLNSFKAIDREIAALPGTAPTVLDLPLYNERQDHGNAQYETMIRLFSRDRNLEKARDPALENQKAMRRIHYQRAYFENQLLEATIPSGLENLENGILSQDARVEIVEGMGTPPRSYTSRVRGNLITKFTEAQCRWLLLPLILIGGTLMFRFRDNQ